MAIADLRKAAVFLLSLPRQQAEALLRRLPPEQAKAVLLVMSETDRPRAAEQEVVLREFVAAQSSASPSPAIRREPSPTPFRYLHGVAVEKLLTLLSNEHPQIIALVFSYLPTGQAAEALAALPPQLQTSVIARISGMGELSEEVVRAVSDGIARRMNGGARSRKMHGGLSNVVKMLNSMRPVKERQLLNEIGSADPGLLDDIRRAMFGADVAACGPWTAVAAC